MRWIFIILLVFLVQSVSGSAEYIVDMPHQGMVITKNTILASGNYTDLYNGIEIGADNIEVICNNTILDLKGDPNNEAFRIIGRKNVTIRGCSIHNYQYGISIEDSKDIYLTENTVAGNIIGIWVSSDPVFIFSNSFASDNEMNSGHDIVYNEIYIDDLRQRVVNNTPNALSIKNDPISGNEKNSENTATSRKIEEKKVIRQIPYPTDEQIRKIVGKIQEIKGITAEDAYPDELENINNVMQRLKIKKELVIDYEKNTTTVITIITILQPIENLTVYEYLDKCILENESDIIYLTQPPKVLENDPLIVWEYGSVQPGEVFNQTYMVEKVMEEAPSTILTQDEIPVRKVCDEEPITITSGCVDCNKSSKGYWMMIWIVPIIIIVFIFFSRFRKE